MAVRIRMKKLGRRHRPFYRICAVDGRKPRDGRVIEELGTYDPMITDTDARVSLNNERVQYWLGVGAQPSEKVGVLIKKYGPNGTHVEARNAAVERLAQPRAIPDPGAPAYTPEAPKEESPAEEAAAPAEEAAAPAEAPETAAAEATEEAAAPAEEAAVSEPAPETAEAPAAEPAAEEESKSE